MLVTRVNDCFFHSSDGYVIIDFEHFHWNLIEFLKVQRSDLDIDFMKMPSSTEIVHENIAFDLNWP